MITSGSGISGAWKSPANSSGEIVVGRQPPLRHFDRHAARGTGDFLACPVVEGDDERQAVIAARQIFRLLKQRTDIALEAFALADDAYAHVVLVQVGEIVADEAAQAGPSDRGSPTAAATSSPS